MASAFTHAFSAVVIGKAMSSRSHRLKFWLLGMFCAAMPDLDVIAFRFGISYSSMWGHRGFTHSIFFSVLFGIFIATVFFRKFKVGSDTWGKLSLYFFLCTLSHGFLDMLTNGGKGVALYAPFSAERFFLPFRPVLVSPIHASQFFGEWGMQVMISEFYWIWFPGMVFLAIIWLVRKAQA